MASGGRGPAIPLARTFQPGGSLLQLFGVARKVRIITAVPQGQAKLPRPCGKLSQLVRAGRYFDGGSRKFLLHWSLIVVCKCLLGVARIQFNECFISFCAHIMCSRRGSWHRG